MNKCSIESCDNKLLAKGMCRGHYSRSRRKNGLQINKPIGYQKFDLISKFKCRIGKPNANGCTEWLGHTNQDGYGFFYLDGNKYITAHRFAYKITHGDIPPGMFICHHCDNPPCVNPEHLWLGTPMDNSQDTIKKNRRYKGKNK